MAEKAAPRRKAAAKVSIPDWLAPAPKAKGKAKAKAALQRLCPALLKVPHSASNHLKPPHPLDLH